jgi:hypothetical protein
MLSKKIKNKNKNQALIGIRDIGNPPGVGILLNLVLE